MTTTNSEPDASQTPDSLLHRMAGPSSGKAGLTNDQTEINQIILEASKGSKFYENEKRKDKELTIRIEKLLRRRDEVVDGADLEKIEASVDHTLSQLEAERDLTQIIVHADMDAFYASVELLDNPQLQGKPFAVGKGVLTTASYEARKYGVRSGMAGFIAKKLCPDLIFVPNRFSRYMEISTQIMSIFRQYDLNMCPGGCDEAYLNVTQFCEENSLTGEECVSQMRDAVFSETKLTVSAGIAPNKMLAKICSDKNKPNGQYQLSFNPSPIKAFMQDLPIRKVPGIGRVNERLLEAIGIKTCGDIYLKRATVSLMDREFGLVFLLRTYLGIASNVVKPYAREARKSIGAERTFAPLSDKEKILDKLSEICTELEKDMSDTGWIGRTVTLKYKLDTYQVFSRAKALDHWVSKKAELFLIGKELLLPELPLKLRLIGLRVTKLKDLRVQQAATGIKRFFEPATGNDPRKRVKTEDKYEIEEAMPGYHEELEETDFQTMGNELDSDADLFEVKPKASSRPPHSTTGVNSPIEIRPIVRPRRHSEPSHSSEQRCPVCDRHLAMDNAAINAHIDFCLSRGVIIAAQKEANTPTSLSGNKTDFKPRSLSKSVARNS